jgi:hypothetical protein
MTLEIRLLSFSTGEPHPLAEQPVIFISMNSLFLGRSPVLIKIVGDFLALLIVLPWTPSENEDVFFLVRWKSGEVYGVSVSKAWYIPRRHR